MILVTGATGFIGRHLVRRLLDEGHNVLVLVHSSPADFEAAPNIQIVEGDLATGNIDITLKSTDTVIHLAGSFSEKLAFEKNLLTTKNLADLCAKAKVRKLIFSSSCAVYGETPVDGASESDPLLPVTMYGLSKALAESVIQYHSRNSDIPAVIARFPNVYGPGARGGVVNGFLSSIKSGNQVFINGDGGQIRDFVYVEDVVKALSAMLRLDLERCEVFNVSRGVGYSLLQLVALMKQIFRKDIEIVFREPRVPDIRCQVAKNQKATALGFGASVSLEEGLARTWKSFQS